MTFTEARERLLETLGRLPSQHQDVTKAVIDIFKSVKTPEKVVVKDTSMLQENATLQKQIKQLEKENERLKQDVSKKKGEIASVTEEYNALDTKMEMLHCASHTEGCFTVMITLANEGMLDMKQALIVARAIILTWAKTSKEGNFDPEPDFIAILKNHQEYLEKNPQLLQGIMKIADDAGILTSDGWKQFIK